MSEGEYEQSDGSGAEEGNEELEIAMAAKRNNSWVEGGAKKGAVLQDLIRFFGSMVESFPKEYAIPDHQGRYKPEDLEHVKLMDASRCIIKAKS